MNVVAIISIVGLMVVIVAAIGVTGYLAVNQLPIPDVINDVIKTSLGAIVGAAGTAALMTRKDP